MTPALYPSQILNIRAACLCMSFSLLTVAGFAQGVPGKGSVNTFDIATWNIEWFGAPNDPSDDELQINNVLNVFRNSDIDLWALQEISDDSDFTRILDSLGSRYSGFLATQSSG